MIVEVLVPGARVIVGIALRDNNCGSDWGRSVA